MLTIKLIGYDPYDYEKNGERKFGVEIHALVIKGMKQSDSFLGTRVYSASIANIELSSENIGKKYCVEMEIYEFRGEQRIRPIGLEPLE